MPGKNKEVDYLAIVARVAAEKDKVKKEKKKREEDDWTMRLPEPQGDEPVDYTQVVKAWDKLRKRKTFEQEKPSDGKGETSDGSRT